MCSIHDHISSLAESSSKSPGSSTPNSSGKRPIKAGNEKSSDSPTVGPRGVYQGHEDTVEEVQFCPSRYSCVIFFIGLHTVRFLNIIHLICPNLRFLNICFTFLGYVAFSSSYVCHAGLDIFLFYDELRRSCLSVSILFCFYTDNTF